MAIEKEEYEAAQAQLVVLAQIAAGLPLEEMLKQIGRAETLGPILDPTLWIKGSTKLSQVKALVQAAMPLKRELLRQIAEQRE